MGVSALRLIRIGVPLPRSLQGSGFKDWGLRDLTLRLRDSEIRKGGETVTKKVVGRIVHFANLPLKLVLPSSLEKITEVAFKTIPSASKIEIKRVMESLYGCQVAKVNTLNMEGKKKTAKGSGILS